MPDIKAFLNSGTGVAELGFRLFDHPRLHKALVLPEVQLMTTYDKTQHELRARPMRWLVTGAAGFIGSHVMDRFLKEMWQVVALDNFYPFYLSRKPRECGINTRFIGLAGDINSTMPCYAENRCIEASNGRDKAVSTLEWSGEGIGKHDLALMLINHSEVDPKLIIDWGLVVVDARHVLNGEGNTYRA